MPVFIKRIKEFDAYAWNGSSQADADRFSYENGFPRFDYGSIKGKEGLIIDFGGNKSVAAKGDYVIKHPDGIHYCVDKRFFERKYQLK